MLDAHGIIAPESFHNELRLRETAVPARSFRPLVVLQIGIKVFEITVAIALRDARAIERVRHAIFGGAFAFAMARGLNGVISVAQGTSVAIQPAGVGVMLAPGELLDPVNDLVEQFSTVMLFASASLGLQRLLIGMSGWQRRAAGQSSR